MWSMQGHDKKSRASLGIQAHLLLSKWEASGAHVPVDSKIPNASLQLVDLAGSEMNVLHWLSHRLSACGTRPKISTGTLGHMSPLDCHKHFTARL